METYYYGHDYNHDFMGKRLERLERTVFRYSKDSSSFKDRFNKLYVKFKNIKSPFYSANRLEPELSLSQMALIKLMENRFFGVEKNQYPLEERVSQLELAIFGTKLQGDITERFEYISKNTPISVKGVRVSSNGQEVASFKPGYKKVPIPTSPYEKAYTPLNLDYDNSAGDYFNNVAQNNSNEILRWKDFPVYVYIHSNKMSEINASNVAIEYWETLVPLRTTSDYKSANILIDWASVGEYVTVPIITGYNTNKHIKVLINMGNVKNSESLSIMPIYIMHQLGHALGIWGHSFSPDDIMYPIGNSGINDINIKNKETWIYQPITLKAKKPKITTRDLNTLLRIYQTPTSLTKIVDGW